MSAGNGTQNIRCTMKFACKLIHGWPVHHFYEPVEALQQCMVLFAMAIAMAVAMFYSET